MCIRDRLQGCQHAFCLGCLVLKFEGKTDFNCPTCDHSFDPYHLVECKVRQRLVESLILKCKCGQEFPSSSEFQLHTCKVEHPSLTIGDLLEMDLTQNPIPCEAEKAALRVIEHKMTETGTIEFATGGPRVCLFKI